MPRKARPAAPSPACQGMCLDVECPTCWAWVQKMDWFGLTNPKHHPTLLALDLDEPTFAVLQHEAADHKTPIETVASVLLREWAEGKAERVPRREAAPFAGANRGR